MAIGSAYVHYILLLSIVIYFIVVFCIYQQNPVSFAFKRVSFVFNVWRAAISCTIFPFALFALVNACPLQCITLICRLSMYYCYASINKIECHLYSRECLL